MSELFKIFSFDLQRFTDTTSDLTDATTDLAAGTITVAAVPTETTVANTDDGKIYWVGGTTALVTNTGTAAAHTLTYSGTQHTFTSAGTGGNVDATIKVIESVSKITQDATQDLVLTVVPAGVQIQPYQGKNVTVGSTYGALTWGATATTANDYITTKANDIESITVATAGVTFRTAGAVTNLMVNEGAITSSAAFTYSGANEITATTAANNFTATGNATKITTGVASSTIGVGTGKYTFGAAGAGDSILLESGKVTGITLGNAAANRTVTVDDATAALGALTINETSDIEVDKSFTYANTSATAKTLTINTAGAEIKSIGNATSVQVPVGDVTLPDGKTYTIGGTAGAVSFIGDGSGNISGVLVEDGGTIAGEDLSGLTLYSDATHAVSGLTLTGAGKITAGTAANNARPYTWEGAGVSGTVGNYTITNDDAAEKTAITVSVTTATGAIAGTTAFKFGGEGVSISGTGANLAALATLQDSSGNNIAATARPTTSGTGTATITQISATEFAATGAGVSGAVYTPSQNNTISLTNTSGSSGVVFTKGAFTGVILAEANDAITTAGTAYLPRNFKFYEAGESGAAPTAVDVTAIDTSKFGSAAATITKTADGYSLSGAIIKTANVIPDYTIPSTATNTMQVLFTPTAVNGFVFTADNDAVTGSKFTDVKLYNGTTANEITGVTLTDISDSVTITCSDYNATLASSVYTMTGKGATGSTIFEGYDITNTSGSSTITFNGAGTVTGFQFGKAGDAIQGDFSTVNLTPVGGGANLNTTMTTLTSVTAGKITAGQNNTYTLDSLEAAASIKNAGQTITANITTTDGAAAVTFTGAGAITGFKFGGEGDNITGTLAGVTSLTDANGSILPSSGFKVPTTGAVTITANAEDYAMTGAGVTGTYGGYTLTQATGNHSGIIFTSAGVKGVLLGDTGANVAGNMKSDFVLYEPGASETDAPTAVTLTSINTEKFDGTTKSTATITKTADGYTMTGAALTLSELVPNFTITRGTNASTARLLFDDTSVTGFQFNVSGDSITGTADADWSSLSLYTTAGIADSNKISGLTFDNVADALTIGYNGTYYTATGAGVKSESLFTGYTIAGTDSEKSPTVIFNATGAIYGFTFGAKDDSISGDLNAIRSRTFTSSAGTTITASSVLNGVTDGTLTEIESTKNKERYVVAGTSISGEKTIGSTKYTIGNTQGTAGLVFNTSGTVTGFAFGGEGDSISGSGLKGIELYTNQTTGEGEDTASSYTKLTTATAAISDAGITGTAKITQVEGEQFILTGDGKTKLNINLDSLDVTADVTAVDAGLMFNNTDGITGFQFGTYAEGNTDSVSGKLQNIKIYAPGGTTELTTLISEIEKGTFTQVADGYTLSEFTTSEEGTAIGDYTVTSTDGGAVVKFNEDGTEVTGFTFGKVGDAISGNLSALAATPENISFTSGSETKTFADINVELTLTSADARIEQTDAGFTVSGLESGNIVKIGDVTVTAETAGADSSISFTAEGAISAIVGEGSKFIFDGDDLAGKDVTINDQPVNIDKVPYTYAGQTGEGEVIDLSESTETEITIAKPGNATKIIPPTGEGNKLTIGETPYTYTSGGEAYFYVDGEGTVGYVFGAAKDAITIDSANVDVYDGGIEEANKVVGPTVDKGTYTITKEDTEQYSIAIHDGSTVTLDKAVMAFSLSGVTDPEDLTGGAKVLFNKAGELVNVAPFVDGEAFAAGDSIDFSGVSSVAIGGEENIVEVADGTFVYGVDDVAKYVKVTNENETVTKVGDATEVRTAGGGSFSILTKDFTVEDEDGVTFDVTGGEKVAGISALEGSVIGDFTEALKVNGVEGIQVAGDSSVEVFGDGETVTKIGKLGSDDATAEIAVTAEGVNEFGADGDGVFKFNSVATFGLSGNSETETVFNLSTSAITGVDTDEVVSGDFTKEFTVDGNAIQVADDDDISIKGGTQILGLTGGASVVKAEGITSAITDKAGTFTFAGGISFTTEGDDEVTFGLEDGNVVSIGELEGTVKGAFDDVTVNGQSVQISGDSAVALVGGASGVTAIQDLSNGATVGAVGGASVAITDGEGKFTFSNGSFSIAGDTDGVTFKLDGDKVVGVEDLSAGATLTGDLGELTAINGASLAIKDDADGFGVVGTENGISQVIKLSTPAEVVNAGGASSAVADTADVFTFPNGKFTISGDSAATFQLDTATSEVVGVTLKDGASISGDLNGLTVNGENISVENDSEFGAVAGADGLAKLFDISAGASIGEVGSASQILTDKAGVFNFTAAGQSFTTADDDEVTFGIEGGKVTSISELAGSVEGNFDGVKVNGAEIEIVDDDNTIKVIGGDSGITKIEGVDADATINAAGSVAELVGNITGASGAFTFSDGNKFVVAGDSQITFGLNEKAEVTSINDLSGDVTGNFNAVTAINGASFAITNDPDNTLTITGDDSGITKIAGVGGGASIGQVGGASQIITDSEGEFTFTNNKFNIEGDSSVTFGMEGNEVASISDLVGTVTGGFDNVTVNEKSVQISGDKEIALVGSASGVDEIQNLSGSATISAADGILTAKTDSEGVFTFADGNAVKVEGDSEVTFTLDGKGNLVSIEDLEETATISGNLNGLTINGASKAIEVSPEQQLWYSNGTLSGIAETPTTVISADDAETVKVAGDGVYTIGEETFTISGDSTGVTFAIDGDGKVTGISDLDADASITGALDGKTVNDETLNVENDSEFGAVAGSDGLAKLFGLTGGASVVEAGSATEFETDSEGKFNILGTNMAIADDNSVVFTAGASGITAIADLQGTATGNFENEIAVNENGVQISGDSSIAVTATDDGISSIGAVNGGATIVKSGDAAALGTESEGVFTFSESNQAFTITGDSAVTFGLSAGKVTGVSELEAGGLSFGKDVTALEVNGAAMTFNTTTNVSLSLADSAVNYVEGVDGAVTGLVNATVAATGSMTVNETAVTVEGDDNFKIVVANSAVVGLQEVGGENVTVGVEGNVSILADASGNFDLNGENFTFTDDDNNFALTLGEGTLTAVDSLEGNMVIAEPAEEISVNGGQFGVTTTEDVTVSAGTSGITAVDGLDSGDTVWGALDNASIVMGAASSTVEAEGTQLTVGDVTYTLLNDADGVTVNGAQQVVGLDENASLKVSKAGDYTVNGSAATAVADDVWVGDADGAHIYDPTKTIIGTTTPVSAIEQMLGLPEYPEDAARGSEDSPLDSAGLSAIEDLDRPLEIFATNDTKETQVMDFSENKFTKKVHMYAGPQSVAFNNDGGNFAIVEDNATGDKEIALGNGGDAVDVRNGATAPVDVTGGTGDDTVVVQGSAPVEFDMSRGGADKLMTFARANARIKLEGYNPFTNPNAGVQITADIGNFADAILNGLLNFSNGVMSLGSAANAHSEIELGGNFVNLFDVDDKKQAVGFTNDEGGSIDGSAATAPLLMVGNNNGQKSGGSTMVGGAFNDTAIAGAGDVVDLGEGTNTVELSDDTTRGGADIVLRGGRTIINHFIGAFNEHGDNLRMNLTGANISFVDGNVVIEGDGFSAILNDVKTNGELSYDLAESADLVESADSASSILGTSEGAYTNVLFNDTVRAAIAKENGVIDVKVDRTERANAYIGDNSGLTFYDKDGEVLVNLAEGTGSIDTDAVTYEGITSVAAGTGQTTLIGGDNNETFIAGTGNDSIYGAGGKNLMIGHNDTGDKTGQTSFFVAAANDGAANTISGFNFVSDDNYTNTNKITADRLDIEVAYDEVRTADGAVDISGNDVVIFVNNRNNSNVESVIIKDAVGQDFAVSGANGDVIAQVNETSLTADKFADYFVATGKNATLTVSDELDNYNIYLGGRPIGTDYVGEVPEFYGDIRVIDASKSNAVAELGGNEYDNTIIAGSGATSLWGGDGGNDLMVAGTGKDTFFYNRGNGADTINGAKDGDIVDLTNITIDQIVGEITDTGVELKFSDGGSLTVNSTANVEYKVGETTYVVNEDRDGWTTK